MDKTALVVDDVRMGRDIIAWLAAAGMPVDDAFWVYQPPTEEWRLFLSSPWVDQKGIRTTYLALSNALHKSPLVRQLPIRRISLLSPSDPLVKKARSSIQSPDQASSRYYWIHYHELHDSYRYTGSLHVVRSMRHDDRISYQITFAPYKGPGGAVPAAEVIGDEALVQFLTEQIGIDAAEAQSALRELQARGSHSFPNVQLRTRDLRKLGLLPRSMRQM